MKPFFYFLSFLLLLLASDLAGQGCVAIRSTGSCSAMPGGMQSEGGSTTFLANYRYFKSFRHFRGDHEEKERIEQNTEVINWSNSLDLAVAHSWNSRWSSMLNIPLISNVRSSLYEHGGNSSGQDGRHETNSFGLGDIRLTTYYWLVAPQAEKRWTVQTGLGIKFATGDYRVDGFFYKSDGSILQGPVDQSIQLGDGGTGLTAEVNSTYRVNSWLSVYENAYYLFNPREENGVSTRRGGSTSQEQYLDGTATMSVPDQFLGRLGVNGLFGPLSVSVGARLEGIPVYDVFGGSSGFRRPGYVVSVEPGLSYQKGDLALFATLPWALMRNRTQSVPDKNKTERTGTFSQGDAAFADWSMNIGLAFQLNGHPKHIEVEQGTFLPKMN
ncbi:MAG: transporter [Saprospiraceae bacterium]|nr:transporter [Saprospiraceae bacterium]